MIFRYVLYLDGEIRRTIRWTFVHPLSESEVIDLPTFGRWRVARVVREDKGGAGIVYCTPASKAPAGLEPAYTALQAAT